MVTKKFLKAKFDCTTDKNPEGLHGRTALHFAAKYGHVEVYRSLDDHFQGQKFKENEKTT